MRSPRLRFAWTAAHRGLVLDSRRSLPPALGVAWRSVRGRTGRVRRGSPRSSASSSSTSRSCCAFIRRGSPRRTARCGRWWSGCCAGSSSAVWQSMASQGPNVRPAARATWSRFLAGGETSARHVRKKHPFHNDERVVRRPSEGAASPPSISIREQPVTRAAGVPA